MTRSAALWLVCTGALSATAQVPAGDFLQGPLRATGVVTDLAIDGTGFFVLRGERETEPRFTRAGSFRLDANGVLVALDNQPLIAFGVHEGSPGGALGIVSLANEVMPPRAATRVGINVNLDPGAPVIPGPIDHLEPGSTTNYQTGVLVFDSLGMARVLQVYFRKAPEPNSWEWYAGAERRDFDARYLGMAQGAPGSQGQFVIAQSGTLTFGMDGRLLAEDDRPLSIALDADGDGSLDAGTALTAQDWPWADGAAAARIAFDFGTSVTSGGTGVDGTTQFGGGNFIRMIHQDGYASGALQSISIEIDGSLIGGFSNGETAVLAQIALARFEGSYWLERIAGTKAYRATEASGPPIYGQPHHAGFGAIRSGFLEDLCQTPQRLCDSLPPLELCEQKLAQCEATGRIDSDADGEPDLTDHCPETDRLADVDTAGCSQPQFCRRVRIREVRDSLRCNSSDWENDEPLRSAPRDCRVVLSRSGRPACSATR
jgi:flagellar hook protein FlgE